jgi:glycosyltransferase involved in cell wall biosynthesis
MRVLQISADRSARGILHKDSSAFQRQEAYAREFGFLDIVAFSVRRDKADTVRSGPLTIFPTNAPHKLLYAFYATHIARTCPMPDVITAQDPFEAGLVASFIARRTKRPLHLQVHTDFLDPAYARHSFLNSMRVSLARSLLPRAARIRVVSHRIKKQLERIGVRVPISVLPIYVDIERARNVEDITIAPPFAQFATKVLVVARLEPEKNIRLAITAFVAAAPEDACLIIVGDGSLRQELEALTRSLGVASRVFFEGEKDAAPYFALSHLVLVPSQYEGYGLVIIEALAAGKPVIATDVGVAREAGAIITSEPHFTEALRLWFKAGPRAGVLQNYPYSSFDEYVRAYCADIALAAQSTAPIK